MKLTAKQAQDKFPADTRVKWSAKFLRSIADYSHASASREGVIVGPVTSYSPTFHVAPIKWDDEQDAGGVNCANIIPVSKIHLEPA